MSETTCKVLFGVWIVVLAMSVLEFGQGVYSGSPDPDDLCITIFAVVICLQFWELWHVKTPKITVNVIKMEDE